MKRFQEDTTSTAKKARIQKPDDFEVVHPDSVTSYGQFGKCEGSECDGVPVETTKINDERLCRTCAQKTHGYYAAERGTFDKSDAEFKCPAFSTDGSCKSEKISFREFYLGSCCEKASKWLTENEKAKRKKLDVLKHLLADIKREKINAKYELDSKNQKVKCSESHQESLWRYKPEETTKLQEAEKKLVEEKKMQEAVARKLEEKVREMNTVDKRYKQLSYEYHEVTCKDDIPEEKKIASLHYCRVCKNEFGGYPRRPYLLRNCGHVACYRCLDTILNVEDGDFEVDEDERGCCPGCGNYFTGKDFIEIWD